MGVNLQEGPCKKVAGRNRRQPYCAAAQVQRNRRNTLRYCALRLTVNAPDPAVRANRLALLSEIRAATLTVADFSKIAG